MYLRRRPCWWLTEHEDGTVCFILLWRKKDCGSAAYRGDRHRARRFRLAARLPGGLTPQKRLSLLHELAPKVHLIAVLLNPNNPFFDNQLNDLDEASRALGLKIHIERASNEREIAGAFAAFARQRAGTLLVGSDPYFNSRRELVIVPAAGCGFPPSTNGANLRKPAG